MTQLPSHPVGQPVSSKARSNVYTALSCVACLMLMIAIGFVLYRSSVLFGSMGELFNLKGTKAPPRISQPVTSPKATSKESSKTQGKSQTDKTNNNEDTGEDEE